MRALLKCLPHSKEDFITVQGDCLAIEVFNCLGEFLKNEYGMQVLLQHPDSIYSIANVLMVKADDKELVQTIHTRVYDALDVICWQSDEVKIFYFISLFIVSLFIVSLFIVSLFIVSLFIVSLFIVSLFIVSFIFQLL